MQLKHAKYKAIKCHKFKILVFMKNGFISLKNALRLQLLGSSPLNSPAGLSPCTLAGAQPLLPHLPPSTVRSWRRHWWRRHKNIISKNYEGENAYYTIRLSDVVQKTNEKSECFFFDIYIDEKIPFSPGRRFSTVRCGRSSRTSP